MGVDHASDVFRQQFRRFRQQDLMQDLGGIQAHYMAAEDFAGLRVGEQLDQALGLAHRHCLADAAVGKYGFADFQALAPGLVFTQAEARHLGFAVDGRGHAVGVDPFHSGCMAGNVFHGDLALPGGHMRQQGSAGHIADGKHAPGRSLVVIAHRDEAAFIGLDAHRVQPEVLGIGATSEHYQGLLCRDADVTVGGGEGDADIFRSALEAGCPGAGVHADAGLAEALFQYRRALEIFCGQQVIDHLHHGHLHAEGVHHESELATDGAASQYDQGFG